MALKRKRSSSELCSSPASSSTSSVSSSPPHNNNFIMYDMSSPAHLNSRTMKRFRNSRPSEEEVHERTLGILYSAQYRPSGLQQHMEAGFPVEAAAIAAPTSTTAAPKPQNSLHRFWNINSAPTAPVSAIDQPTVSSFECDDCGCHLGGGNGDDMDIDGQEAVDTTCMACGKHVCFSCSVSNLGQQRRCLHCAGRKA